MQKTISLIIIVYIVTIICIVPTYAQKSFFVGVLGGMRIETPKLKDEGGFFTNMRTPSIFGGLLLTQELNQNYALEYGIHSSSLGTSGDILSTPLLEFAHYLTIIQIPVRIHRRIYTFDNQRTKIDFVGGFSYLYNWNKGDYGIGYDSQADFKFRFIGIKQHIFLLDFGAQIHHTRGRIRYYAFYYFNKAFTDLAKIEGTYSYNGVTNQKIQSIVKGNASNLGFGIQYGIYLPSYKERQEKHKQKQQNRLFEQLHPFEPYRTLRQFTRSHRLALVVGSPIFFTQKAPSSHSGAGSVRIASTPSFMLGLDYYHNFNAQWALHTGLRAGAADYVYTHQIEGENLQINSNLSASYHTPQMMLNVPIGLMRRFPISQRQAFQVEAGLNLYAFGSADVMHFQSEDPNYEGFDNADLKVDYDIAVKPFSATPYLQVGLGTLLKKGNMLQIDLLAQPSLMRLMRTNYGFYNNRTQDPNPIGEGTFTSGNGAVALQMSYVFNNLKRQQRKGNLGD